jgi:hypothetical protein
MLLTSVASVNLRISQKPKTAIVLLPGTIGFRSPFFLMFSAIISAPVRCASEKKQKFLGHIIYMKRSMDFESEIRSEVIYLPASPNPTAKSAPIF